MSRKRISVMQESYSGRNVKFHDNYTGTNMSRTQFVDEIKHGNYPHYHVRKINGLYTPVSNPDRSELNNLD